MAGDRHTLETVGRHLILAMEPLTEAGGSLGAFRRMLARLGFDAADLPPAYAALAARVTAARAVLDGLSAPPSLPQLTALLAEAKGVFDAIRALAGAPAPAGVDAGAYASEIGDRLFELLLTDYLAREATGTYHLLATLNVIRTETVPATAGRATYERTRFDWAEIPRIVSSPGDLPEHVYGWGQPGFDVERALDDLAGLLAGLGFPVAMREPPVEVMQGYTGLSSLELPSLPNSLEWPFFYGRVGEETFEAAFRLRALPEQGTTLPGVILEPRIPSQLPLTVQLHPKVRMRLRAGTNVGTLFGLTIRPGQVALSYPLAPGTPPPSAGIGVGFDFVPAAPAVLVGDPAGSRIELAGVAVDLGAEVASGGVSLLLGADLSGLKLVIAGGDGDSFISRILGDGQTEVTVPLGLEWSQAHGIRFKGSPAFSVTLHPHLKLGPVSIDEIDVGLAVPAGAPPRVQLELGASLSGALGPLTFMVRGIGLRSTVTFADGNAGPFGISIGFKPPNGVGLSIDAGGFTGGGFLLCDPDKGEYAGGLELTFAGTISVRALGILTTKLPDGEDGFSLLILIVSEFPPIQLSYGFTLLGVGGLLGLNRTILLDQLAYGVRDGSLNSILFPVDVVANAPRIIGDLKRVFPAQEGHFLVGPMAKLGWGTPTLITLSLGLILDLPRPAFAVIGVLRMALPAEDLAILNLQVSFAGSIDFERGQFMFDASLFDSRVLTFTLTGDMAVRIYWKDNANLLLSAGGFHPAYEPPPMNLGQLTRLGIVIFQGNPHVRAEAYFAVTANTVQFGARIEAHYGVSAFNVHGMLGLDVIIHRNPFHFVADIAASVCVRSGTKALFSIRLQLMLEGPSPWHAKGTGSFEIGFIFTITIRVGFDVTRGEALSAVLPPFDVLAEMVAALANPGNWRPRLPPGYSAGVALREMPNGGDDLIVHPFGGLEIAQKVVPLGVPIQHFGSRAAANGSRFEIANVKIGTADAPMSPTREQFAPAQFFEMSDAEKLSRPSFAPYDAGILVGGDPAPRTSFMRPRDVTYELLYLPQRHPLRVRFGLAAELGRFLAKGAAAGRSALSPNQRGPSPLADRVSAVAETFAVVSADDLTLHREGLVFGDATVAARAVEGLVRERPELRGSIEVIPATMMKLAA